MKTSTKLTLIALLWISLINTATLVIDTDLRLQMAHAWWTNTPEVQIKPDMVPKARGDIRFGVVGVGGKRHILYDPGQSILMLPGDWLGTQLSYWFPALDEISWRRLVVSLLIFLPINIAAVLSCFWLLKLLGFTEQIAGLSSLTWLLGTTFFYYALDHQQNNQILLLTTLGYATALAHTLQQKNYWVFLSGLAGGGAVLIRFTSLINGLTVLIFLIGCTAYQTRNITQTFKVISLWIGGLIPLFGLGRLLDYLRFGSFWSTGAGIAMKQAITDPYYARLPDLPSNYPFINPPSVGILGVLFSLPKSIFIYDPLLLPCLLLAIIFWQRFSPYIKWYVITAIFNLGFHLILTSRLEFWHGDTAWGARYHVTSIHLLLIPLLGIFIQHFLTTKGWQKKSMTFIITLAITVQMIAVAMPSNLEVMQIKVGMPGFRHDFRLGQRIKNIACLANPFWSDRCIENNPEKKHFLTNFNHLAFFPFVLQQKAQTKPALEIVAKILLILWGFVLILAIRTTIKFCYGG